MTTTAPTDPDRPDTPPAPAAVIALPVRDNGWKGRYLHHAPGPGQTAQLLREVITTRYPKRDRYLLATDDLIRTHPGGWAHLGSATPKDPEVKPRRRPAPAGRCYCHQDDGTVHPNLAASAYATLLAAEDAYDNYDKGKVQAPHAAAGDGTPWMMRSGEQLPESIEHVFVLYREAIEVRARNGAKPGSFATAGLVPYTGQVDLGDLDRAASAIRARTVADRAREHLADQLARTARRLGAIAPHIDLVLYLLGERYADYVKVPADQNAEAALARSAGVHTADLPGHLLRLGRADQITLLKTTAHHLSPGTHPAP